MALSPICPTCGCSLVRLGIGREQAASREHDGERLFFCCEGCAERFDEDPERYLAEISGWIVCPTCLGEKPQELTVSITHDGREIRFCRCPGCTKEFLKRPDELLARLRG